MPIGRRGHQVFNGQKAALAHHRHHALVRVRLGHAGQLFAILKAQPHAFRAAQVHNALQLLRRAMILPLAAHAHMIKLAAAGAQRFFHGMQPV